MNIQPVTQNNISSYGSPRPQNNKGVRRFIDRTKQKVLDILPNKTLNGGQNNIDKWNKVSDKVSRPAENKIIVVRYCPIKRAVPFCIKLLTIFAFMLKY